MNGEDEKARKERESVRNYDEITASPETLGAFLASLPIAIGPWDESFHKEFCNSCERENCDVEGCPNQDKRNNPTWWLKLSAKPGKGALAGG